MPRNRIVRYAVVGLGHIAQVAVLPALRTHVRTRPREADDRVSRHSACSLMHSARIAACVIHRDMRTIVIVFLLMGLPFGQTIRARPEGSIRTSIAREAVRIAHQPATQAAQEPEEKAPGVHPILIGAIIGAATGAVVGAVGTSCSADPSPVDAHPCGTHPRAGGAVLGALVGGGVGAVIGFVVKKVKE
jgi:hypothetical protein